MPTDAIIREAVVEDHEAMAEILVEFVWQEYEYRIAPKREVLDELVRYMCKGEWAERVPPGRRIDIVAVMDGEVVGVLLANRGAASMGVAYFAVKSEHRRLGIGRRLWEELEWIAVVEGRLWLHLFTFRQNVNGIRFYERMRLRRPPLWRRCRRESRDGLMLEKRLRGTVPLREKVIRLVGAFATLAEIGLTGRRTSVLRIVETLERLLWGGDLGESSKFVASRP